MKLMIFAGGIGTRLWPLSRENSPKQFDRIFGGRSTLQLAVERVEKDFGLENIYIQTVPKFKESVKSQIGRIDEKNIILEPMRRNLGPAICLAVLELKKRGYAGPMAILWADHLMKRPEEFIRALKAGEELIKQRSDRFVFIGEKARFANNNLGWINTGDKLGSQNGVDYYTFCGWKYKPEQSECDRMFDSGNYFWNSGYFITSIDFLYGQYQKLAPDIYEAVKGGRYEDALETHFDRAIIEKVDLSSAVVIKTDMGWSDPGTLYALKEALEKDKGDNITQGEVVEMGSADSLIYNLEEGKLVTAIGLQGMVVVNTPDALIVVHKHDVVGITGLVKKLRELDKKKYL